MSVLETSRPIAGSSLVATLPKVKIWLRATFWAAVAISFVMALWPQPLQLPGSPSDKLLHALAFATLAALASLAFSAASGLKLVAWLSAYGAAIELAQAIPSLNRDSEAMDWLVDTLSAAVVVAIIYLWRHHKSIASGAAKPECPPKSP